MFESSSPINVSFHAMVPPEVLETIIAYLDFRSIMMIIPRVCSSWREMILQHINTLHIYPNVDLYGGDFDHRFFNKNEESYQKHMMIEKDIIPFVRYLTKFVESNQMKILHLFIHGSIRDANLDRYAPARPRNEHFPSIRQQRKKEFINRLVNYLPNYFTEPDFSLETFKPINCSFIKLNFCSDSNVFSNLIKACKDNLQTLSLKSCTVDHTFCSTCLDLVKDKLENLVLDNVSNFFCTLEFPNLKYLYNDTECNIKTTNSLESVFIGSKIFYEMETLENCKNLCLHLNYSKAAEINQLSSILDNRVEELQTTLGAVQYSYWDEPLSLFDSVEMTATFIELLTKFKHLKKLSIILEHNYDFALLRNTSPVFLTTKDANLKELPDIVDIKLEGHSFFTNRVDEFLKYFPNIKRLSCHVNNDHDIEYLQSNLLSLRSLEHLDLSIGSPSSGELGPILIESLLCVFREGMRTPLKSLCIRGYYDCTEKHTELENLLEFLSNSSTKFCLVPRRYIPLQEKQSKYEKKVNFHILESKVPIDKALIDVKPIDYSKSINEIIEERKIIAHKLKTSNIICLFCGSLIRRCDYEIHNSACHHGNELEYYNKVSKQLDLKDYETYCLSCHQDIKRRDFPSHKCSQTKIKLLPLMAEQLQ